MDEEVMGLDEYTSLPMEDRFRLDAWLESLGGKPHRTRSVTLYRETSSISVEEYILKQGKLVWDKKIKGVKVYRRTIVYQEPPPIWPIRCS